MGGGLLISIPGGTKESCSTIIVKLPDSSLRIRTIEIDADEGMALGSLVERQGKKNPRSLEDRGSSGIIGGPSVKNRKLEFRYASLETWVCMAVICVFPHSQIVQGVIRPHGGVGQCDLLWIAG